MLIYYVIFKVSVLIKVVFVNLSLVLFYREHTVFITHYVLRVYPFPHVILHEKGTSSFLKTLSEDQQPPGVVNTL